MKRQPSLGKCELCTGTFSKASMTRHLAKCLDSIKHEKRKPAFHLSVEGGKIYWLHLAMSTTAPLSKLDRFLRDIWLECCGHMSSFHIGTVRYSHEPMDEGFRSSNYSEKSTTVAADKVLAVGSTFSYEYDYGSTTELRLKVLGLIESQMSSAVELLARNDPPEIFCDSCGAGSRHKCAPIAYGQKAAGSATNAQPLMNAAKK
ncbi:MAG TPA: hypothetical protein VHA33_14025 [Candidatus Angelobacter sp.]|nr:hypothetical protein [Candidatus Angelobacter sp.]